MRDTSCHFELAQRVLLVRPTSFWSNVETAKTNHFQKVDRIDASSQKAQREFDGLKDALTDFGIEVSVFESDPQAETPDAVFPNNWFSTHANGQLFIYPMEALNRRRERRLDIINYLRTQFGPYEIFDFSSYENSGKFLEGTGSLVLDRKSKIGFCCLSSRSHPDLIKLFENKTGYSILSFESFDRAGMPIYHTNVMMSLGRKYAAVCVDSIQDIAQKHQLVAGLEDLSKKLIPLRLEQIMEFCGNILLLQNRKGECAWFLSQRAFDALDVAQRSDLKADGELIPVPIPTIENLGGGSVRCMIAEIFKNTSEQNSAR